jgi:hypothetical protein
MILQTITSLYQIIKTPDLDLTTKSSPSFFTANYGEVISGSSINYSASYVQYSITSSNQLEFIGLKNSYNYYKYLNSNFEFSNLNPTTASQINLLSIPSAYYGSSIKRGSLSLKFVVTGTNIAEAQDIRKNGELIQLNGTLSGSTVGMVMYNEGFIILTSSANLNTSHQESYSGSGDMYPNWTVFAHRNSVSASDTSFDFDFEGVYRVPTLTMICEAKKTELNYSNNQTFIDKDYAPMLSQSLSGSNYYEERRDILLKNVTYSPYTNYEETYEKQTFITKIGIYDENKKLIATAKLANPVRKTENRDLTFKLKIDL